MLNCYLWLCWLFAKYCEAHVGRIGIKNDYIPGVLFIVFFLMPFIAVGYLIGKVVL